MAKYNYSVTRENARHQIETLQVINCDSFDEAIKVVEKGVYDRELWEAQQKEKPAEKVPDKTQQSPATSKNPPPAAVPDMVQPLGADGNPIGESVHPSQPQ